MSDVIEQAAGLERGHPPDQARAPRRRGMTARLSRRRLLGIGAGLTAAIAVPMVPLAADLRVAAIEQEFAGEWARMPVLSRGSMLLGITFRPLQIQAFGMEVMPTLAKLLEFPIQLVRMGAYWRLIEPQAGVFDFSDLDRQIDMVEQAGAQIILCVGALKTFGFPEFHIPAYRLAQPFPDHTTISPSAYPDLLRAASDVIARIVERYKDHAAIIGWQLENEPLDPIPFAHYWRLSRGFVLEEMKTLRSIDATRPVMINGTIPTALSVRIGEAWLTRDQGDSLTLARDSAQVIGIDYYPRIGIWRVGPAGLYLNSTGTPWGDGDRDQLGTWASAHNQRIIIAEGQAEPWEVTTVPPSPAHRAPYSCTPEDVIQTYNWWADWALQYPIHAYLFWGADYWLLRANNGDPEYLSAFARVLGTA